MRQLITFAFSSFACLTFASVAFGQVPHTFIAGTPARAAEVNENFEYLDDRISDNVTGIAQLLSGASIDSSLVIVDSLGNVVGPAINFSISTDSFSGIREATGTVNQANVLFKDPTSGKIFKIGMPNLVYQGLATDGPTFNFLQPNCTGTIYMIGLAPSVDGFELLGSPRLLLEDGPISTPSGKGIYYPTSEVTISATYQSVWDASSLTCQNFSQFRTDLVAYDGYVDFEALHPPPYRLAVN